MELRRCNERAVQEQSTVDDIKGGDEMGQITSDDKPGKTQRKLSVTLKGPKGKAQAGKFKADLNKLIRKYNAKIKPK